MVTAVELEDLYWTEGLSLNQVAKVHVKVGSKQLYEFLARKEHVSLIEGFPADFIKGFADSEGSVSVRRRTKHFVEACIAICNSSQNLLNFVANLLKRHFGITSHIILHTKKGVRKVIHGEETHATKNTYSLNIYAKNHTVTFYRNIGFSINRKMNKLRQVCNLWANM